MMMKRDSVMVYFRTGKSCEKQNDIIFFLNKQKLGTLSLAKL